MDYNLTWRFFNDVCFGGELSHAKIHCFKGAIWSYNGQLLVGSYHTKSSEILMHTGKYANDHLGGPLEALYHEMVHQYIEEVLDASDEAEHGRLFHEVYTNGLMRLEKMASKKKAAMGKAAAAKGKAAKSLPPWMQGKAKAKGSK